MTAAAHSRTAPEDRVSMPRRLAYGAGAFVNNLLGAASGNMMIVLNLGLGMDPVLVGWLGSIPRATDAITDPLMGFISDGTRSRWGRRRPYIFVGAFLAALTFALLWQLNRGWSQNFTFAWFLVGSIIFYIGYTMFATPWVALGYELTPDYNERTRLMGTQYFVGNLAFIVSPWFLAIMNSGRFFRDAAGEPDQVTGAKGLAIVLALVTMGLGVLPAIFLRERIKSVDDSVARAALSLGENTRKFLRGFLETLRSGPFLKLCAATFLVFNGFQLIASFQTYVLIYYVFAGDQAAGAVWAGWTGTVSTICAFGVVAFVTWLGTRIGKRQAFIIATSVAIVGYALKWVCYRPDTPWLALAPAPLMAFSLSSLFTLMPSMIADVVDLDELKTHERREGMYGAIFWFMVKVGLSAALIASGYLLNATGFDVELGGAQAPRTITLMRLADVGVPVLTSLLAIWAVARFPITEAKANQVRAELERRRGKA